jgi:hypothetical protein
MKIKYCKICKLPVSKKATICRTCYNKELSKREQGGAKNSMWKGGRTLHSRGYVYIKDRKHPFSDKQGYIFEHRLIMEQSLGRYLESTEIIHHINGIKNDNRIENLELMEQGQHLDKHGLTWGCKRIPWNKGMRI